MKFIPFIALIIAWPPALAAQEYRPSDYASCVDEGVGIVVGDEEKCAILSGNVSYGFGWDSKNGILSSPPTFQGRMAVTASEIAAIVLGVRSSQEYRFGSYAPGATVITFDGAGIGGSTRIQDGIAPGLDSYYVDTTWLNEAFVSLGGDASIRLGLIDTTFDSLGYTGDEQFLLPRPSILSPADLAVPSPITTKMAVEARWQVDARVRHGMAFQLGNDDPSEIIVRSDFALGDGTARVISRMQGGSRSLDARFALDEMNQVIALVEHGSDETWRVHGGVSYKPGPIGVGMFFANAEQDTETMASVNVGDRSDGVAGYVIAQELSRSQEYRVSVREIGASIAIWAPLRLEAALGSFSGTLTYLGDLTYAKVKVGWLPEDSSIIAEITAETNSAGANKGTVRVQNRLH